MPTTRGEAGRVEGQGRDFEQYVRGSSLRAEAQGVDVRTNTVHSQMRTRFRAVGMLSSVNLSEDEVGCRSQWYGCARAAVGASADDEDGDECATWSRDKIRV